MSNTTVILQGRGQVTLRASDHVSTGGEGSAYRLNNTVVKVFTDPQKMAKDDMVAKISLLSKIKHPWITAPLGIVSDLKGKAIGYYMPFAPGQGLPRFFTNDYRAQIGFADTDASVLVDRMKDVVQHAHDNRAIIVDGNEYGWLVEFSKRAKPEPHIVDVDSWAIDRWKPSVIMPSIVDHHAKGFTPLSDWFSWGIVTFQVYTGIHPFKGTLDGFPKNDFTTRMKKNASVFSPGIRLNRAVRDFSCIPPKLRDWYIAEFQNGARSVPPSPFDTGVSLAPSVVTHRVSMTQASGSIVFDRLTNLASKDKVVNVFFCGAVVLSSKEIIDLANSNRIICSVSTEECEVVKVEDGWLIAEKHGDHLECFYTEGNGKKEELKLTLAAHGILRYGNRLFAVTQSGITELLLKKFAKPILALGNSWPVLTSSTQWFDGVGVQNALGAMYLVAPYGDDKVSYVRVRELDGYRTINARSGERFIAVVAADKKGELHRFEFVFDKSYASYKLVRESVDTPELVLAILPKGVAATVVDDGELKIIVPTNGVERKVADRSIVTDELLYAWENTVVLIRAGNVWRVKVV